MRVNGNQGYWESVHGRWMGGCESSMERKLLLYAVLVFHVRVCSALTSDLLTMHVAGQ